jgi:signal transduction histidine kinase
VIELQAFKRQQLTFSILNLITLAILLLIHIFFANHFGLPTPTLVVILGCAFLLRAIELVWTQSRPLPASGVDLKALTWASIVLNLALAFTAAVLTNRPDAQYFVLLVVPVIEAAFNFGLVTTSLVILAAGGLNFLWIIDYSMHQRGPIAPGEYFEAATISLIYAAVGFLVWMLVRDLRRNQADLASNLCELDSARERLVTEEKLAAVGRLSSAIAHEIRNPVAMIFSSLATAARAGLDNDQRQAMYDIATHEAGRLEQLTNDFLAYARPRPVATSVNDASDLLMYVADLSRAKADSKHITLLVETPGEVPCECDISGLQQVLLNLVMNAIDACPQGGTVALRISGAEDLVHIEVENPGPGVPTEVRARIFEPFFTTKPHGTGLGLAIARKVARSHGGDVTLATNGPDHVTFCVAVPASRALATTDGRN